MHARVAYFQLSFPVINLRVLNPHLVEGIILPHNFIAVTEKIIPRIIGILSPCVSACITLFYKPSA